MAAGRTHNVGTLVLVPVVTWIAWELSHHDMFTTSLAGVGCFCGIFISPDLDMKQRTVSETTLLRWSLGIGYIWIFLWYPYAMLFRHRGISHTPVFGTITRVLYLLGIALMLQYLAHNFADAQWNIWPWVDQHQYSIAIFIAGLGISDIGHWVLDHV
ncbi:DUF2227 family putative metal-binding protein [Tunicatimonas pelagia]|uniref:DUF2227 family putative metal-binding protein n=1 Tax=Tunicatimonas pelagia TaxID=931531 RepID=UPI002665DFFD|nr:DUF2227 family putative metal-binding protein [Tunicatimonas pelagia]WKN40584.1 DUF2227 family putative metal-binding protein [Tunicatimonas pelagia]